MRRITDILARASAGVLVLGLALAGAPALAQPATGGSVAPPTPPPVLFAPEQEAVLWQAVASRVEPAARPGITLEAGRVVSREIPLQRFPEDVFTAVPGVRSYRYIYTTSGIAMVDPTSRTIVQVIEAR